MTEDVISNQKSEVDCLLSDATSAVGHESHKTTEADEYMRNDEGMASRTRVLDGGWGWSVAVGGFITNVIIFGLNSAIGLVYVELQNNWGGNADDMQWIGSLQMGLAFILGPLTSCLSVSLSCRIVVVVGGSLLFLGLLLTAFVRSVGLMYFTLGFLPGLGNGLIIPTSLIVLNEYFVKKLPLANGIVVAGSGLGGIMIPPLMEYCLESYGYQGAMLIFSAIVLHVQIAAVIYVPKRCTKGFSIKHLKNEVSKIFDKTLMRSPSLLFVIASNLFYHMVYFIPYGFLPNSALSYGIRKNYIPWLMSVIGLTSFIGRPVAGFLGILVRGKLTIMYGVYLVGFGLSMTTMLMRTYPLLMMSSALIGFTGGGTVCLCYSMVPEIVPIKSLNNSLGIILLFQGVGSIIGTPIAGFLRGSFNADSIVYVYACGMCLLSAVCLLPVYCLAGKLKQEIEKSNTEHVAMRCLDEVIKV